MLYNKKILSVAWLLASGTGRGSPRSISLLKKRTSTFEQKYSYNISTKTIKFQPGGTRLKGVNRGSLFCSSSSDLQSRISCSRRNPTFYTGNPRKSVRVQSRSLCLCFLKTERWRIAGSLPRLRPPNHFKLVEWIISSQCCSVFERFTHSPRSSPLIFRSSI